MGGLQSHFDVNPNRCVVWRLGLGLGFWQLSISVGAGRFCPLPWQKLFRLEVNWIADLGIFHTPHQIAFDVELEHKPKYVDVLFTKSCGGWGWFAESFSGLTQLCLCYVRLQRLHCVWFGVWKGKNKLYCISIYWYVFETNYALLVTTVASNSCWLEYMCNVGGPSG